MRYRGEPLGHVFAGAGDAAPLRAGRGGSAWSSWRRWPAEVIQRAHTQTEAEQQRRRLDAIIEHLPIVIAVLDRQGRVVAPEPLRARVRRPTSAPTRGRLAQHGADAADLSPPTASPSRPIRSWWCAPSAAKRQARGADRRQPRRQAQDARAGGGGAAARRRRRGAGGGDGVPGRLGAARAGRRQGSLPARGLARAALADHRLRATTSLLEIDPTAIADPERARRHAAAHPAAGGSPDQAGRAAARLGAPERRRGADPARRAAIWWRSRARRIELARRLNPSPSDAR